jgi:hypothetical protein
MVRLTKKIEIENISIHVFFHIIQHSRILLFYLRKKILPFIYGKTWFHVLRKLLINKIFNQL